MNTSAPPAMNRHCDCHGTLRVAEFQGTPEAELLAIESHQLLHELEPVLTQRLALSPDGLPGAHFPYPPRVSLFDPSTVSTLSLLIYPLNNHERLTPERRCALLNAFGALGAHSQRLNAFPALKRAFWLDVFKSLAMMKTHSCDLNARMLETPAFPRLMIDFSSHGEKCDVNEALGKVLLAFMTTPARAAVWQTPAAHPYQHAPVASIGFSFAECKLAPASLTVVESFLDRAFAHPARQYDVHKLNLSDCFADTAALAIFARIVEKSKRVYRVEELALDKIMPAILTTGYDAPRETPEEFLDIVRAAFFGDDLPRLVRSTSNDSDDWQPLPPAAPATATATAAATAKDTLVASTAALTVSPPASRLRRVTLEDNYLCPKYFVARFSALRYGCPLPTDSREYPTKEYARLSEKIACWRWVAFGLFYPRPKRFTTALTLRTIGTLDLSTDALKTYIDTLRNPVAALLFDGDANACGSRPPVDAMVVTVKQGARIDVVDCGSKATPTWTGTLQERSELEGLYTRKDGAVCVVVPGVGLGWVQLESIESVERETLETCRAYLDGRFHAALDGGGRAVDSRKMREFIALIGHQLGSLTFMLYDDKRGYLEPTLDSCPHLEHLDVRLVATQSDLYALARALQGELGRRLLTLSIDAKHFIKNEHIEQLASIIACSPTTLPVLRELQLYHRESNASALTKLDEALQANRTITAVQLLHPGLYVYKLRKDAKRAYKSLKAAHGGRLLRAALPSEKKLALLSVVARSESAQQAMEPSLLELIFAFAADRETRRTVAVYARVYTPRPNSTIRRAPKNKQGDNAEEDEEDDSDDDEEDDEEDDDDDDDDDDDEEEESGDEDDSGEEEESGDEEDGEEEEESGDEEDGEEDGEEEDGDDDQEEDGDEEEQGAEDSGDESGERKSKRVRT